MKPIERVDPTEARRTLGVFTAPDGEMEGEMAYLQEKVDAWVEKIRTKRLPHELVWESLTRGIYKSLEYPLTATTFEVHQCEQLMKPLLKVGLSHDNIINSMKR